MTFAFKRRIFQEVTGSDSSPAECPNGIVYNATLSADTVSLMFFVHLSVVMSFPFLMFCLRRFCMKNKDILS